MSNYSLILKLIADDKQFKAGFDKASTALKKHEQDINRAGLSYNKLQSGLNRLNDVAMNAALTFGVQSKEFKEATAAARAYQNQINAVNDAMEKQGLANQKRKENSLLDSITGVALKRIVPLMVLNQLGKAFVYTTKTIMEFNEQLSVLEAVSGESQKGMKSLADSAIKIASVTPVTTREVVQLQIELAKLGLTRVEILSATEAIVNMSIAGMIPLGEAAEIAASTMKAFGMRATDIARIADVMATSFNVSAMDIERFSTSMALVSPAAKAAGYTLEFTTAALSVLVDRGMDASIAGTSLRNIFMELSKTGMDMGKIFDEIRNSVDPLGTALKYFETRTASAAVMLANNTDELKKFAIAMYDAAGASEHMADIIANNLTGDLKELGGAWEAMVLRISTARSGLGQFIRETTQGLTNLIRKLDYAAAGREGRSLMAGANTFEAAVDWAQRAADDIKAIQDKQIIDFVNGLDAKELFTNESQKKILEMQEESYQMQADAQIKAIQDAIAYEEKVAADRLQQMKEQASQMSTPEALKTMVGVHFGFNSSDALEAESSLVANAEALRLLREQLDMLIKSKEQAKVNGLMNEFIPEGDGTAKKIKNIRELTGAIEILRKKIADLNTEYEREPDVAKLPQYRKELGELNIELQKLLGTYKEFELIEGPMETIGNELKVPDLEPTLTAYSDFYNTMAQMSRDFLTTMMTMGISDVFEKMANKDSEALDNYGWKIMKSFGDFLVQMGGMMVAYGTAKMFLESGAPGPWIIGAGLAMMAIGAAMSGYAKGNMDKALNGGSSGVPSSGSSITQKKCPIMEGFSKYAASETGGTLFDNRKTSESSVEFVIKGDTLVGVLKKNGIKQASIY